MEYLQIKSKIKYLITILLAFTLLFFVISNKHKSTEITEVTEVMDNSYIANTDTSCPVDDLYLDELPEYITQNTYAVNLLKDECSLVTNSFLNDIDADNEKELFIQTSKLSCGTASCKTRDIYIIDNQETVFHKQGYDTNFRNTDEPNAFEITEQIKYWDEPPCCSSKKLVIKYIYDPDNEFNFTDTDTYIETTNFDK